MNKQEELEKKMFSGKIVRSIDFENLTTTEENDNELIVEGIAVVFNRETLLFSYGDTEVYELVDPNAFTSTDMRDVIFNYNHDGRVYARNNSTSLKIWIAADGVHMRAVLYKDDRGHLELYNDIKRGYVNKMSYQYSLAKDGLKREATDTKVLYRVLNVKKLYDVSAVAIPAYDSTSIEARSLDDIRDYESLYLNESRDKDFIFRKKKLEVKLKLQK